MHSSSLFAFAIMSQVLIICLAPELVMLMEKAGRRISYKLNLGMATLAFILVMHSYFWIQFGSSMSNTGVNLTLMSLQTSSLYVASFCLRKLHEDALSNENRA